MSTKMSVRYGDNSVPMSETSPEDSLVRFTVKNDSGVNLVTFAFDYQDLPEENVNRTTLYGLNKLLTDRTSDQKDKVAKLDEMQVVFDLLCSGEWAKERTVGAVVVSCEVEALAAMQNMSIPDTQAALAQYDKEVRAQILGNEEIVKAAAAIRAGRKESTVKSLDEFIG